MMVRLPHSLAASRHVPETGFVVLKPSLPSPPQVATSDLEVMITGLSRVPSTKICAPFAMARLPPTPVSEAMTVPASMVSVQPGST